METHFDRHRLRVIFVVLYSIQDNHVSNQQNRLNATQQVIYIKLDVMLDVCLFQDPKFQSISRRAINDAQLRQYLTDFHPEQHQFHV